jgi:signal transduction histidine kinase
LADVDLTLIAPPWCAYVVSSHRVHTRRLLNLSLDLSNTAVLRKDPGLPSLFPFKEQMMEQMEQQKIADDDEKQRRKQERLKAQMKKRSLPNMVAEAQQQALVIQRAERDRIGRRHIALKSI